MSDEQPEVLLPEPEPIEATATERPPVEVIEVEPEPEAPREPDPAPESPTRAALAVIEPEQRHHLVPGRDIPIIPEHREMQGLAAMAVTLAGSGSVPEALRNAPNDVFQVLLTARDLGVAVTTGMREFHVIKGRVTLSPKVKLAMVNERGQREGWQVWPCTPEYDLETRTKRPCWVCGNETGNDGERAAWHATRRDRPGNVFSSEFTMEQAKGVKDPGGKLLAEKDNWKNYPGRMLSWRSLGYLLDDVFPEVGTGLYSPDELGAMTDEDGQAVIDVASTEPLPGTKAPRNHGPKPPDPREALLSEADADTYAAIRERIDGLVPDAVAALKAMWQERVGEEDTPRLPPLPHCQVKHKGKVLALVASIEKRQANGEWGEPPAEGDDEPGPVGPVDGSGAATPADEAPEASTDELSAPSVDAAAEDESHLPCPECFHTEGEHSKTCKLRPGALPSRPEPEPVSIPDRVKAMELAEVLRELDARKDSPLVGDNLPGSPKAQRALLEVLLTAEANAAAEDQAPE